MNTMSSLPRVSVLALMFCQINCSDLGSQFAPTQGKDPALFIYASPSSGQIGTMVTLSGTQFVLPPRYNAVRFTGGDALTADSGSASVLYSYAPFGASNGPIRVALGDGGLATSNFFTVTEAYDSTRFSVAPYDISPPVTARDSFVVDRMGVTQSWHATLQHDTVHLRRRYFSGRFFTKDWRWVGNSSFSFWIDMQH